MNCTTFRRYLFAFADSQLSVRSNCEILDHLKMCKPCSSIVEEHQILRAVIRASANEIETPPGLEDRVRQSLLKGKPVKRPRPFRSSPFQNSLVQVTAAAACIALSVLITWQLASDSGSRGGEHYDHARKPISDEERTAQVVVATHRNCDARCNVGKHQHDELPDRLEGLSSEMAIALDGRVSMIAPDLSGYGYEFDSANFCSPIAGKAGNGGHIMYVKHENGTRLSLFCMARWSSIEDTADVANPFVTTVDQCNATTVVAWHEADTTYLCCATIDAKSLRQIAQDLQTALSDPDREEYFASAFTDR